MTSRKIERKQFLAIKKQLAETNRIQADIAAEYGVGSSTVSVINAAGTWGNYLAGVKAPKPIRRNRAPSPAKESLRIDYVQEPQFALLHPFPAEEDNLAKELAELDTTPTPSRLDSAVTTLNGRMDNQLDLIRNKQERGEIPFWQFAVDVVLFFLVIAALVK